jgi:predicted GNAT family N-acyltransferase
MKRYSPMLTPIHQLTPAQIDQLHQMYLQEWWSKDRALADVPTLLNNTDLLFGLWHEEEQRLAAFARVLTDWVYRAIVFDVIVAIDYRGRGLGATLVEHITTHPRLSQVEFIQLFCTPEMQPFYQKYGFGQSEQFLMVRPR